MTRFLVAVRESGGAVTYRHVPAELLDGRDEHLSGDVERVLGRSARDFAEYAKGAAPAWAR